MLGAPSARKWLLIARRRCYRRGVSQFQVGPETIVHVDYRLFDAEAMLQARYPDAAHTFPESERQAAYRFIDRALKHAPTKNTTGE